MPQFNLTTATPEELRQLLASTRRRGDAALSYQILQEMAARREAGEPRRGLLRRRPAEPRHIAVDLGDPLEPSGEEIPPMPNWRPPSERLMDDDLALPPRSPEAAPRPSRRRPPRGDRSRLTLDEAVADLDPAPAPSQAAADDPQLRLQRDRPEPPPPRRASRFPLLVFGLALGIPLGMAFGWWVATTPQARPAAPAAQPTEVASVEPQPVAPAPTALIPTPPEAPAAIPAATPPAEAAATPAPETPPEAADPKVMAEAAPPPPPLPAEPARETAEAAAPAAAGCAAEPTPADREICATPRLRRLQEELRHAYAQALEAHQDRALLRSRQLAWRDSRSAVADPGKLASLYSERIRKLNAATEAARSQR